MSRPGGGGTPKAASRHLVMVHGMWGGAWCWENYAAYFSDLGYECHIPVLRHHGVSPSDAPPPGLGTTGLEDYARDLGAYILDLPESPVLMGHSMGGLLVQMLAQQGLASRTVLLAPAPPAGIHALSFSVFCSFFHMFTTWAFWRKPHKIPFKTARYSFLHHLTPEAQHQAYDRLVHESGCAASQIGLWPLDPGRASCVDERAVTCPQLIIGAENDRIVPAAVVRKVAKKYRATAQYHELPGFSHWLLGEPGWEDVAALVAQWLGRADGM